MPVLLTTQQAAEALGVSIRTIHRMAASGDLPSEHKTPGLRGAWLFSSDAVEAAAQHRGEVA